MLEPLQNCAISYCNLVLYLSVFGSRYLIAFCLILSILSSLLCLVTICNMHANLFLYFICVFKVFSENLIDGSCLPKLTETHLTTVMGIKLGPAIKLITSIKSMMPPSNSEATCLHCNHCHSSPTVSINQ